MSMTQPQHGSPSSLFPTVRIVSQKETKQEIPDARLVCLNLIKSIAHVFDVYFIYSVRLPLD